MKTANKIKKQKELELLKLIKNNTTYKLDYQSDVNQVVVWCESFGKQWSLCFQNGDMNGELRGTAVWNNAGADTYRQEFLSILKERNEFKDLIDENTYWKYDELMDLMELYIEDLSEKENINSYFDENQDDY